MRITKCLPSPQIAVCGALIGAIAGVTRVSYGFGIHYAPWIGVALILALVVYASRIVIQEGF